ncbi:MAG: VIT1/CCC1 transporter family protein [Thermoplasmata archaeon]|jgi:predicted membrane protein (TIGR00267 family)|nr:VIT1/CCC1 transporter family protein [Thermoplasmata archaeon]
MSKISESIKKMRFLFTLTKSGAIARRYFVIGAFDGALTILGVILGAYVAEGATDPVYVKQLILGAGFAGAVALAVSSTVGAYEAERVEHLLTHRELERAMLRPVEGTRREAINVSIMVSSISHGVAPMLAALVPLVPFYFLPVDEAVATGIAITIAFLFVLGAYLGSLIKEMLVYTGLRFVIAGLGTAIVLILIGGHP